MKKLRKREAIALFFFPFFMKGLFLKMGRF